jgi:hypothetical protein
MSQYRFSEDKEKKAEVIREMVSYLRNSFQTHQLPAGEIVSVELIEKFAADVLDGSII